MDTINKDLQRKADMELRKWCIEKAQQYIPHAEVVTAASEIYTFVTAGGEYIKDSGIVADSNSPAPVGIRRKSDPQFCPELAAKAYERTAANVQSLARLAITYDGE